MSHRRPGTLCELWPQPYVAHMWSWVHQYVREFPEVILTPWGSERYHRFLTDYSRDFVDYIAPAFRDFLQQRPQVLRPLRIRMARIPRRGNPVREAWDAIHRISPFRNLVEFRAQFNFNAVYHTVPLDPPELFISPKLHPVGLDVQSPRGHAAPLLTPWHHTRYFYHGGEPVVDDTRARRMRGWVSAIAAEESSEASFADPERHEIPRTEFRPRPSGETTAVPHEPPASIPSPSRRPSISPSRTPPQPPQSQVPPRPRRPSRAELRRLQARAALEEQQHPAPEPSAERPSRRRRRT